MVNNQKPAAKENIQPRSSTATRPALTPKSSLNSAEDGRMNGTNLKDAEMAVLIASLQGYIFI